MLHVSWLPFLATSLLIILTPGQDMVLVMSRTLSGGTRTGVVTAAGVSVGLIVHTMLATLGLGALLQASEWLFTVLKLAGALYLLYLGVTLLRSSGELTLSSGGRAPESALRTFAQGALSNVSNPKVALFYLAFLPQFVQADAARPMLAVFVLGATFAGLTFLVKGPVALFAGLLSTSIRRNPRILTRMHRVSGVVLLGLGVKLALERR
ncbi:LysE family translocator [Burkholderia ubonensis]|uniref:Threonine transporter RhtB n=1 Tax=Burkholderia ubonensis TaxID=101571 RepID=A0A107FI71_9BURK|nr:LysE family translocator [Burkholderia ubonensis]AOK62961.1 threonine transporter RhtB [Burkholderia ubonensis]KVS40107.1 threonine transporter RhtB [Burkholderia ubonensis]KVS48476.1 threonine transporter RhtB [Burkholderia ubonensis]KVS81891.1 threonine transporter RhtB [Burkholderia ubonensis]KVS86105.1 threonine transporter RhtB [Burkholderia ubonensis]